MDPLAQLHDIILPPAPGLWPLAWGWWVLLALAATVLATGIWLWRRHRQRHAYRQAALAELAQLRETHRQSPDAARYLQSLAVLLRRAAIAAQPRHFPRDIQGEAWLAWLDAQCPAAAPGFSQGPGRILLTGPYQANPQTDIDALDHLCRQWLRTHRNHWQAQAAQPEASHA